MRLLAPALPLTLAAAHPGWWSILREAERLAFVATLLVFALVLAGVWS